jgi:hypothetical protein
MQPNALLTPGDLLNNTANWNSYADAWGALKPILPRQSHIPPASTPTPTIGVPPPTRRLYFSFDLGSWHVVALNGELDVAAGSPEETWFRADLAARPARTAVFIHEPRWSIQPTTPRIRP